MQPRPTLPSGCERLLRLAAPAAALAAVPLLLAAPASAAPPEGQPFAFPSTLACDGFTAAVEISGTRLVHTTPDGHGGERTITVLQDVRSVYTSPTTGATVAGRRHGVIVTVVDADGGMSIKETGVVLRRIPGEGNAIPFAGQFAAQLTADGEEVVLRDVGLREDADAAICAALAG